jgi:putative flippase GtrA
LDTDVRAVHPSNGTAAAPRWTTPLISSLSKSQRFDLAVGGLTIVVFLALQLLLLLGPHPYDPSKYFSTAVDFPHIGADRWTLRSGLIAPVVIATRLMGAGEAALYAVPLSAGVLLVSAVYGTMLALFKDRVLAAATALVATLNADFLLNSSFIFPDNVATATFAMGFLFLLLGGLVAEGSSPWPARWSIVCAGVFFGWTYLIREFSPILLPTVIASAILLGYSWRRLGLLAGAAVATGALELLYGALGWGRPFIHVQELLQHRNESFARRAETVAIVQDKTQDPVGALLVLPRLILSWDSGWLLLLLAPIFVAALVLLRDRRLWLLAMWCLGFWAAMVVLAMGELPSGRWIVNVSNVRYWYPLFPALAMSGLGGLWLLIRRFAPPRRALGAARLAAVGLAALILLPGMAEFHSCAPKNIWRNDPLKRWQELRSWLGSPEASRYSRIRTNANTARGLNPAFLTPTVGHARVWDGSIKEWPPLGHGRIEPVEDIDDTLILLNQRGVIATPGGLQGIKALAPEWSPVFVSSDGALVLLAHRPAPEGGSLSAPWWERPPRSAHATPGECGINPITGQP